jgi:hypothetical protein
MTRRHWDLFMAASGKSVIPASLRANVLAWWDAQYADRSQVSVFKDYSGNSRDATMTNFAGTTSDGWSTSAPYILKGDGSDSWIGREQAGFIAQDADFSYVCCFSPSADNAATYLGYGLLTNFTTNYVFRALYTGTYAAIRLVDRVSGTINTVYLTSISSAQYYVFIVTYSSADKKIRLYINSSLAETTTALSNGHNAINYTRHYGNDGNTAFTAQKLGFSAWFNKTLSADEVKAVYNANCIRFGLAAV